MISCSRREEENFLRGTEQTPLSHCGETPKRTSRPVSRRQLEQHHPDNQHPNCPEHVRKEQGAEWKKYRFKHLGAELFTSCEDSSLLFPVKTDKKEIILDPSIA
ncbi:hypothetical protein J6590_080292 [Homalodisca vitripennis]|nr:hypothetical protein J6590_080292 [Homalodisca vitripennis]